MEPTFSSRLEAARARAREQLAQNPLYRRPEWVAAHARLLALLPNATETISAPYNMVPDKILAAATAAGLPLEEDILYNPWRGIPDGRGTKPWESYEKLEMFDAMFSRRPLAPGPLWFLPHECFFSNCDPYRVASERLRDFVAECKCDLCHDALFIWCEHPRVSLIHHAGAFFHIELPAGG